VRGQREPDVADGWTVVEVRAASLNHHDLWSLGGVPPAEDRLPMILGSTPPASTRRPLRWSST
jgi:NADPH:quinone reductase-like Zn-dependent oxidoreductase